MTKLCVTKLCVCDKNMCDKVVCVKDGVTKRTRKQRPVVQQQSTFLQKQLLYNRDFLSRENSKWKLPRPLRYRMTRNVHSSKGRERKVGVDVEDFPPSLQLGVGEDVDEVENWLELQTGTGCVSENMPQ